jgi:hypothetical protein
MLALPTLVAHLYKQNVDMSKSAFIKYTILGFWLDFFLIYVLGFDVKKVMLVILFVFLGTCDLILSIHKVLQSDSL